MDIGFTKPVAAMSIGLLTAFSIIGRLIGGALGDRIEPKIIWSLSMLIMLPGIFIAMVAASPFHIYLYAILVGIGFGASFVSQPTMIGNYYGANNFASVIGLSGLLLTVLISTVPFISGWIFDAAKSYNIAFIGASALCAAGFFALLLAKPERPPI